MTDEPDLESANALNTSDDANEGVRIYSDKADLSHRYDIARLLTFRKA